MPKYYKELVGDRQVYWRIANSVKQFSADIRKFSRSHDSNLVNNVTHNIKNLSENSDNSLESSHEILSNLGNLSENETTYNSSNVSSSSSDENKYDLKKSSLSCNSASNFKNELKDWAVRNKVTHTALTELLHILSPLHPDLPLSSKTFLHTPQNVDKKKLILKQVHMFILV